VPIFCMSCADQVDKSPIEEIRSFLTVDLSGMVDLRLNKAKDQLEDLTSTYLKAAPKIYQRGEGDWMFCEGHSRIYFFELKNRDQV
jgi:hypothetical protein